MSTPTRHVPGVPAPARRPEVTATAPTTATSAPAPATAPTATGGVDLTELAPTRPLGTTDWRVWGLGLLRSSGFSVAGLDRLGAPRAARAAQAVLEGSGRHEDFVAAYEQDTAATSATLAEAAGDERLRRAIAWQNPALLSSLDKLRDRAPGSAATRRQRERTLAMYWQRYCSKAETIGFFGPSAWIRIGQGTRALDFRPGAGVTARSRVFLERWMVAEVGAWMFEQPDARRWFPLQLRCDVHLDAAGRRLLVPGRPPVRLGEDEVLVLQAADGDRHLEDLVDVLGVSQGWDHATARVRVEKAVAKLSRSRWLVWDANIPISDTAEDVLRRRVDAVGDPELFLRFDAVLTALAHAREQVAAAATTQDLLEALGRLDALFVELTGKPASRDGGKAYAGRSLCYEDTTRDCELWLGSDLLDRIAAPLALVADAGDWFGARLAQLVEEAVADLVRTAATRTRGPVTLADVWPGILGLFWGQDPHPVRRATAELARRWAEVVDLDLADAGRRVELRCEDLAERARIAFALDRPVWPHLGVHSPDLQLCAASVEAVNAGDCTVVLGELHACLCTLDLALLDWTAQGPRSIRDRINAVLGVPRIVPLFPPGWRRNTGRFVPTTQGTDERLIGFSRVSARARGLVDAAVGITLADQDGVLVATGPDGHRWAIPELLGVLISMVAADAFKIGLDQVHAPRLSIDGLVVFRETWRLPACGMELPAKPDRHRDYLAARAWVARHHLPDQVFVKFPGETKPVLFDLTSTVGVLSFVNLARAACREDPHAMVTVSEPLPDPRISWLPDVDGNRYVSEIRLQLVRADTPQTETSPGLDGKKLT